jgi:hypothetical protein
MKILLDECVPWPIHRILPGHACMTAQQREWGGIKNGDLLQKAESEFDLFLTADQVIRYQQNLTSRRIAVLQLSTNKLRRILTADKLTQSAVDRIQPGELLMLQIP